MTPMRPWSLMTSPAWLSLFFPLSWKSFDFQTANKTNNFELNAAISITRSWWKTEDFEICVFEWRPTTGERAVPFFFFPLLKHLIWWQFLFRLASCSPFFF
jgi:hypothetical protein